jgi:hypothetical protein
MDDLMPHIVFAMAKYISPVDIFNNQVMVLRATPKSLRGAEIF